MKYHAIIEYGKKHYFWNWAKESIINEVLIPFINGQVILISIGGGKKLLNLRNASRLTLYCTSASLVVKDNKSIINQMEEGSFSKNDCTEKIIQEAKLELTSEQTYSLLQKSFAKLKDQVFVIMKFGDRYLDSAFEGVIVPLFEKKGYSVIRVDQIQDSGKITDQMLDFISESKIILADLTGSRPNCYYETGFAHALGKEIILTCKKDEKIHFDLAGYRFITWETEKDFRDQLESRIDKIIEK
jgi:hypothetical protein